MKSNVKYGDFYYMYIKISEFLLWTNYCQNDIKKIKFYCLKWLLYALKCTILHMNFYIWQWSTAIERKIYI